MRLIQQGLRERRGMTLVELMIVVAVIGVLASIAGVSYVKYIKSAKIGKLEQYAMEVGSLQVQRQSSGKGEYYDLSGVTYTSSISGTDKKKWENVLGFSKKLEPTMEIDTVAGAKGAGSCSICEGVDPSFETIWFAVRVTQDLDGDDTNDPTTVVYHNELPQPMVLNEGQ